jgi:hypothetical protein
MTNHLYHAEELLPMQTRTLYERSYPGTPFSIIGTPFPGDKPSHWTTSVVHIYREGRLIGGYRRLYSSFGAETFAPFQWKGAWYALYSANYTCTRVLLLREDRIEDWCGEESSPGGFCPTEYYAPQGFPDERESLDAGWTFDNCRDFREYGQFLKEAGESQAAIQFPGFAFLSGCVWGDDSDWKLRYIDYSGIEEKRLIVDDRFGYHPLPNRPLHECVDLSYWSLDDPVVYADKRTFFVARPPAPKAS